MRSVACRTAPEQIALRDEWSAYASHWNCHSHWLSLHLINLREYMFFDLPFAVSTEADGIQRCERIVDQEAG